MYDCTGDLKASFSNERRVQRNGWKHRHHDHHHHHHHMKTYKAPLITGAQRRRTMQYQSVTERITVSNMLKTKNKTKLDETKKCVDNVWSTCTTNLWYGFTILTLYCFICQANWKSSINREQTKTAEKRDIQSPNACAFRNIIEIKLDVKWCNSCQCGHSDCLGSSCRYTLQIRNIHVWIATAESWAGLSLVKFIGKYLNSSNYVVKHVAKQGAYFQRLILPLAETRTTVSPWLMLLFLTL